MDHAVNSCIEETKIELNTTEEEMPDHCMRELNVDQVVPRATSGSNSDQVCRNILNKRAETKVIQHKVTYRCSFHFKPEMLQYYYNPGPMGYDEGNPILLGSPVFQGGWNTKWRVCLTINRWIGMERWISLYITRVDVEDEPLHMQCEFRVIKSEGKKALHSKRNILGLSAKNTTGGFDKFLLFTKALEMLCDDKQSLCIETHLTLISTITTNDIHQEDEEDNGMNDDCSDETTIIDAEDFTTEDVPLCDNIKPDDVLQINLQGELVAFVSRTKLVEKSLSYQNCIRNNWDCRDVLNFSLPVRCEKQEYRKIMKEFVTFVNDDHCKTLESGSFDELSELLDLAVKTDVGELASQCLTAMSLNLTPINAVRLVIAVGLYHQYSDENILHCTKTYFKQNFEEIRKTEDFRLAIHEHSQYFVEFCFDPNSEK